MIGVGLEEGIDAAAVASSALEGGLIVNPPRPDTIRLLPPLTVTQDEVRVAVKVLADSIGRG